jgi:hypothetical protein
MNWELFFLAGALNWQNMVLAVGGILFTVALIPVLRNSKAAVPLSASLLTAAVLTAFLPVYASLGLWFGFAGETSTAVAWWLILIFRRVKV